MIEQDFVVPERHSNLPYSLARLAAGETRGLTGTLSNGAFSAQLVDEQETEAIVPELQRVSLIQVVDRRPKVYIKLDGPGREMELRKGGLIVIPSALGSYWQSRACGGRVLHMSIEVGAFEAWTHGEIAASDLRPGLNMQDRALSSLTQIVADELVQDGPTSALYLDSLAVALAVNITRAAGRSPRQQWVFGGLSPRSSKRVTDYLMAHLAENVALAELAAIADLSPHHFCRAFRQSTGLPPHAWLVARRMERAQEMMIAHPNMGLIDIALAVGYQSHAAFGAAFRRATGVSPGQWRRGRLG